MQHIYSDNDDDAMEPMIHRAADRGDVESIARVLDAEPDEILRRDAIDNEPLHRACDAKKPEAVRLLIDRGADVNARGDFGQTPLHWAVRDGGPECCRIVEMLLEAGADATLKDDRLNEDALGFALREYKDELEPAMVLLRAKGAGHCTRVRLRPVEPADLPILCEHQLDPEAARLAAVVPRQPEAFHKHWTAILPNPDTVTRTILADEAVVGQVTCFPSEGQHQVGYWIGREHWGRGIATRALQLFLEVVSIRPLHATVATTNTASIRALLRNGFTIIGTRDSPATDRYLACEETILRLGNCG